MRSKERLRVSDYFQSNKVELFNIWLDSGKDWDHVKLYVDRVYAQVNQSTRGYVSVKGRDLKEQYGETKGQQLIDSRKSSGCWYADDDFPTDPDDS